MSSKPNKYKEMTKSWSPVSDLFEAWYLPKMKSEFGRDLLSEYEYLNSNKWDIEHPGWMLEKVLSRLKLVEILQTEETHGQFIEAGFFIETSLRIYLITTTFDQLGQSGKFITYLDWLSQSSKKEKYKALTLPRDEFISKTFTSKPNNIDEIKIKLMSTYRKYLENYGMGNAFQRFFHDVLGPEEKADIVKYLWINTNPYAPNPSMIAVLPPPTGWIGLTDQEKIKKIGKAIEIYCRNAFTHNGERIFDATDRDEVFGRLKEGGSIPVNDVFYFNDMKKVLCSKEIRFTIFIYELALKGIANKMKMEIENHKTRNSESK